jgi:hypothetical protein
VTTREALHALVDTLPEDLLAEAEDSLERLAAERAERELAWTLENAPLEDEPLSPPEIDALRRYDAGRRAGRVYTEEELVDLIRSSARG